MKTLNIALVTFALIAGAGSAALANDGPHNRDAGQVSYSDSFQDKSAVSASTQLDQQSQATLALNLSGERASQNH